VQGHVAGIRGQAQAGQGLPVQAGEHGDAQQLGPAAALAVGANRFGRRLDHGRTALGMNVDQGRVHGQERLQGTVDRGGDVVKLEVEEDRSVALDLPDEGRALGAEQFEADLEHAHPALELAGENNGLLGRGHIQGDDETINGGLEGGHGLSPQ
jgi:hypothetical protein